jgi:hypothetical protein
VSCPWGGYAPATIAFCERRLCAWVVEPSNAWSNVAYVLVGLWILRRTGARGGAALSATGVAAVLLGIGSFAFHATGVRVFEVVDVSGMYLISGLALTFPLQRLVGWSDRVAVAFFAACVLVSSGLMIALGTDGIVMFGVQIAAATLLELRRRHELPADAGRWLGASIAVLLAGLGIWQLDRNGTLCDADNHLVTGHAVWHVLTAVAVLLFYRYQDRLRHAVADRARR